jgi:protein-L-isoaspartate(D-aspartate) O-methyltransferase
MGAELTDKDYSRLRHRMVEEQLRPRGIADEKVLATMEKVPRHLFVPPAHRHKAYDDGPLPIAQGQTISQPYIVARMTELLSLSETSRVLEVGTGSGYQAAVLGELAGEVWTVERISELAEKAEELLGALGYQNVRVILSDGTTGFQEAAPYDGILVSAAAPRVPESLRRQLVVGGRMVIPISAGYSEDLTLVERLANIRPEPSDAPLADEDIQRAFRETTVLSCVFVPLIGVEGYEA